MYKLQLSVSLCMRACVCLGVQRRSLDLDSLATRLEATGTVSHRAPAPTLLTCSMGGSVDVRG